MQHPQIIQGGMGVAISTWQLAHAVSSAGQLGVVSGTGIAPLMIARLQEGDEDSRRAVEHFPIPEVAERILDKYFVPGGVPEKTAYKRPPMWRINPPRDLNVVTAVANFVEVWLAKEGHDQPVGINLLEKVQMPLLASLYGAMLAHVDYVIIGAGIPMQIPGVLDCFAEHKPSRYPIEVKNSSDDVFIHFDPEEVFPGIAEQVGDLYRPYFLPIISSDVLAKALIYKANGRVDGFVVETPIAGGHNAAPRGRMKLNDRGEPIYGKRDTVNLEKLAEFERPFWLAGGYGKPGKLHEALDQGATGIQVGTAFAYCDESGLVTEAKRKVLGQVRDGTVDVYTDPVASPTGFPFKVVQVEGTLSEASVYEARSRVCDLGFLRHQVMGDNGRLTYRCPAEPVDTYVKKGGKIEETEGRTCLCNNLFATAGFGQWRGDGYEPMIITSGDALEELADLLPPDQDHYSAQHVIDCLLQSESEK